MDQLAGPLSIPAVQNLYTTVRISVENSSRRHSLSSDATPKVDSLTEGSIPFHGKLSDTGSGTSCFMT